MPLCNSILSLIWIMINKIEILAPAGGFDSVVAAVRNGADAVYLGEKEFSARASAHNFDEQELKDAVRYCHIHGVKAYVTLNTIIFDDEFERLKNAIEIAARADVDALIVQNMGVARLARQIAPKLHLHASTQMSVHSYYGVKALYEMGFERVVLSREMSSEEIRKCSQLPVELEVFVHGALCMCVSGQCYFSAMLGSRSGNRGACAQPCRLPFAAGKNKDGYALSLKDNSIIEYIGELEHMGVASAKIEGRMKRPEYVAAVVRACREQRDNGFISEETKRFMTSVFSRSGFTDGYYKNKKGYEMFGTRRRDDVVSADEKLFAQIRQTYKDELSDVPVSGKFTAKLAQAPVLEVSDGIHSVTAVGDVLCEKALKVALASEKCENQLKKTGSTAYFFESLSIDIEDNISLPLSVLNMLRRDALAQLDDLRAVVNNYEINEIEIAKPEPFVPKSKGSTRARVLTSNISDAFKECELVYLPLYTDINEVKRLVAEGFNIGLEIPRGLFGREDKVEKRLAEMSQIGVSDVLCHSLAAVYMAKMYGLTVHGGFGLNLVNTYDMLWAEEYGIKDVELSFELTFDRINRLGGNIDRGIITYGYLPLMLTVNCPNKSAGIDCKTCKNKSQIIDRKGERFTLKCDGNCTEILNCVPLFIDEKEFSRLSTSFNILRFNVENYVESVENLRDFNTNPMLKDKSTRGLYIRGVK